MTTELHPVSRTEERDHLAEHHLVHRVIIAMAIVIPICALFFGGLLYLATHIAGVPSGAPTLMGVGVGVLSGVFFGTWVGVVASVNEVEHIELEPVPGSEHDEGGEAACWSHLVCDECGRLVRDGHAPTCSSDVQTRRSATLPRLEADR